MKKINIFIFSSIFYLAWIFINNFFENIIFTTIVLFFIGLFFTFLIYKNKNFKILSIFCLLCFSLWILVSKNNLDKIRENQIFLLSHNWQVEIISEIQNIKEKSKWNIIYKTKIISIDWEKPKNNIFSETVILDKYENLEKWQIIKNEWKLYFYKDFWNFSYKNFMISNWFYFKNFANKFEKIWKNEIWKIEKNIIKFREFLLNTIKQNYPENEAIFLWWILLWAREELPEELKENFNNSWLTHFIAVSGFNITILIIFFSFFLKFFPKKLQIISMLFIIFLFVILVWPSAPVVRAWIMWFLGYLVVQNWRQWNILAIALLTLIIMVSENPNSINYDTSLHLSFLAVFWIIYSEKFFSKIFWFLPNFLEIRTAVSITFAALVFTLPIMIFGFWQVSIIAPLTNLLVSWSIPIAMLFWSLSLLWFAIFEKIWIFFWFLTFLFLKWNIEIVNFFWNKDFSIIKTNFWEYSWYFQIIYFLIMIFIILYFEKEKQE